MFAVIVIAAALMAPQDGYVFIKGQQISVEDGSFNVEETSAIREAYGPNVFYFRSDGRTYIVRDAAILKQIDGLFAPQRELGDKQGALGEKQAALGRKQAELGARQARAGGNERLQNQLSRHQEDLARQQQSLGDIQSDLGHQQEAMSREIRDQLQKLTKEWIRNGAARPLQR